MVINLLWLVELRGFPIEVEPAEMADGVHRVPGSVAVRADSPNLVISIRHIVSPRIGYIGVFEDGVRCSSRRPFPCQVLSSRCRTSGISTGIARRTGGGRRHKYLCTTPETGERICSAATSGLLSCAVAVHASEPIEDSPFAMRAFVRTANTAVYRPPLRHKEGSRCGRVRYREAGGRHGKADLISSSVVPVPGILNPPEETWTQKPGRVGYVCQFCT